MNNFIYGICYGILTFSFAQMLFLPCGGSCQAAFIRKATKDSAWAVEKLTIIHDHYERKINDQND